MQTDATLLGNNSQHCWMLHVASVCTPCCMLLDVAACCCTKFETGQTFQPTTPNISFVPWSPKRSATMLNPFAQLFQHRWGHACSLRLVYKDLWVVYPSHDALQVPTLLGVVASICRPLPTCTQQLPTLLTTMLGVVASVCTQTKVSTSLHSDMFPCCCFFPSLISWLLFNICGLKIWTGLTIDTRVSKLLLQRNSVSGIISTFATMYSVYCSRLHR